MLVTLDHDRRCGARIFMGENAEAFAALAGVPFPHRFSAMFDRAQVLPLGLERKDMIGRRKSINERLKDLGQQIVDEIIAYEWQQPVIIIGRDTAYAMGVDYDRPCVWGANSSRGNIIACIPSMAALTSTEKSKVNETKEFVRSAIAWSVAESARLRLENNREVKS